MLSECRLGRERQVRSLTQRSGAEATDIQGLGDKKDSSGIGGRKYKNEEAAGEVSFWVGPIWVGNWNVSMKCVQ